MLTLSEIMSAGGAIMWILFALSIAALAIFFERAACYVASKSAIIILDACAISNVNTSPADLKMLLDSCAQSEIYRWERGLSSLEMIARISPLLGLLGTVLGMVDMFGSLHAGGGVSADAVTGGIWKALFTTVAGLAIAVPTAIAHSFLSSRVDRRCDALEVAKARIIEERIKNAARA